MLFHVCCSEPNIGVALIAGDGRPICAPSPPSPRWRPQPGCARGALVFAPRTFSSSANTDASKPFLASRLEVLRDTRRNDTCVAHLLIRGRRLHQRILPRNARGGVGSWPRRLPFQRRGLLLFRPLRCGKTHLSQVGTASERPRLTVITGNGSDQASVAESPIALPPVFGNEECASCNSVAQVRSARTIDRSVPNAEPRCTLLGVGGIRRLDQSRRALPDH
jgi:hypothetical protein